MSRLSLSLASTSHVARRACVAVPRAQQLSTSAFAAGAAAGGPSSKQFSAAASAVFPAMAATRVPQSLFAPLTSARIHTTGALGCVLGTEEDERYGRKGDRGKEREREIRKGGRGDRQRERERERERERRKGGRGERSLCVCGVCAFEWWTGRCESNRPRQEITSSYCCRSFHLLPFVST